MPSATKAATPHRMGESLTIARQAQLAASNPKNTTMPTLALDRDPWRGVPPATKIQWPHAGHVDVPLAIC
jgi:hypothetical protein